MLKKQFTLIFLATIFLFFDKQIKAMQEPNLESTSKNPIKQSILNCKHEPCNTLKFQAASKLIEILKAQEIDINTSNTDALAETLDIPKELIIFCKQCSILSLIHKHIISLEQFEKDEDIKYMKRFFKAKVCLNINEENLYHYNKLLHELFYNGIDVQNVNVKKMLNKIRRSLKSRIIHSKNATNSITLEDIIVTLNLIQSSKEHIAFSEPEIICLNNIWKFIWGDKCTDLFMLIVKNKKLLPQLNEIIGPHGETFFMFLIELLNNTDLFESIINEEKNKNYDWEELFNIRTDYGEKLLHFATGTAKNIFEVILKLMKEKDLSLNNRINENNNTILMEASCHGNYEIVKLLLDHGANKSLLNSEGKTALDLAIKYRTIRRINLETLEKLDQCIELLNQKQPGSWECIMQ